MKADIYRWVFKIPIEDVKIAFNDTSLSGGCFFCGKKIKDHKYNVHYLATDDLVSSEIDFEDSQGLFPIGNECRKRLPNNFVYNK